MENVSTLGGKNLSIEESKEQKEDKFSPNNILEESKDLYSSLIVIGITDEGSMILKVSSSLDTKDLLWIIEKIKLEILNS